MGGSRSVLVVLVVIAIMVVEGSSMVVRTGGTCGRSGSSGW